VLRLSPPPSETASLHDSYSVQGALMRDSLTYLDPPTALNPRSCLVLASRFWPCRRGRIDDVVRRSTKRAAALVQIQRIVSTPQGPFVAAREDQLLGLDGAAASHVRRVLTPTQLSTGPLAGQSPALVTG
jgi:hypothetical protein